MGHKYIVCPWLDENQRNADGLKRASELFNKAGEASQKAGIQFYITITRSNSRQTRPLAESLRTTLSGVSRSEVRQKWRWLCWISVAGKDPVSCFEKYPRFPLVHEGFVTIPTRRAAMPGRQAPFPLGRLEDVAKVRSTSTDLRAVGKGRQHITLLRMTMRKRRSRTSRSATTTCPVCDSSSERCYLREG